MLTKICPSVSLGGIGFMLILGFVLAAPCPPNRCEIGDGGPKAPLKIPPKIVDFLFLGTLTKVSFLSLCPAVLVFGIVLGPLLRNLVALTVNPETLDAPFLFALVSLTRLTVACLFVLADL